MTDEIFFDTDCIAAFLWVNNQSVLAQLYSGKIVIPRQTYNELASVPHLQQKIDALVNDKHAEICDIDVMSPEHDMFLKLTTSPDEGYKIIGDGEAASIALAHKNGGVLASNNLSDIMQYVELYNLNHITTGDIMVKAYKEGIITEAEGNNIWHKMLKRRRKIGANSFTEYLINQQISNS